MRHAKVEAKIKVDGPRPMPTPRFRHLCSRHLMVCTCM